MIPDPLEKTVLIPTRIRKGKVEFFYGGPLPELKDGVVGDLKVPRYAVLDKAVLKKLEMEDAAEIRPTGARLGALINIKETIEDDKMKYFIKPDSVYVQGWLVEIALTEPLKLRLRGTKKGELYDCGCTIKALDNRGATSINQAYTLISQIYETHRRSHSGNVFEKVYCWDEKAGWQKLGDLRDALEAKYEKANLIKKVITVRLK